MTTVKLNNTEFVIENYNRSTYFSGETMTSNASCTVRVTDASALSALITENITFIQIKNDGNIIYTLDNINAKIDSVSEYLSGDHISTNINMLFILEEEPNT